VYFKGSYKPALFTGQLLVDYIYFLFFYVQANINIQRITRSQLPYISSVRIICRWKKGYPL